MENGWITGIVVGLVMLGGQFLVQPLIAEKEQSRKERWNKKMSIFLRANMMIRQQFASGQMDEPGQPVRPSKLEEAPSSEQIMSVYSELLLVVETTNTVDKFLPFMPGWSLRVRKDSRVTLGDWGAFVNAARSELGFKEIQFASNQLIFVQDRKPN